MSLEFRDFNLLSLQLKESIDFLKSCRINESNKGLFVSLDKAIDIGKSYLKVVDGFKEMQLKNIDMERFKILINKNCNQISLYIEEIDSIKSIAN